MEGVVVVRRHRGTRSVVSSSNQVSFMSRANAVVKRGRWTTTIDPTAPCKLDTEEWYATGK